MNWNIGRLSLAVQELALWNILMERGKGMIDYLEQLKIDIDRLEYYEKRGDSGKIEEYKNLIVLHAKQLCKEQGNNE